MLRVASGVQRRLTSVPAALNDNLTMTSENDDGDGDVDMRDVSGKGAGVEDNNGGGRPTRAAAAAAANLSDQEPQSSGSTKKGPTYSPHVQMLKPKNSVVAADNDAADTSFVSESETNQPSSSGNAHYPSTNGGSSGGQASTPARAASRGGGGDSTVFGTFRSSIPQEVFEKIKERITASREREKQSVAKQILRKEEEKRKLAREQDKEDLEATIRTVRENIRGAKQKRQLIYNQLKQKLNTEEGLKKQLATRDRGREMSNHVIHHSYPNAMSLISQTNPSMRPRLMQSYPPINLPMNAIMQQQQQHQSNPHLDTLAPNQSKRQRSVSPGGQIPGPNSNHSSGSSRLMDSGMSHGRGGGGHLQPPPNKMARPGAQTTPDTHGGPSQSSRMSGIKSPNKGSTPVHGHNNQGSSGGGGSSQQLQQQPVTMAGPFAVAPYGSALGNQVLCLINPNMVGAAANSQPQFINPAFLQKPEHLAALTQQQQQAIMAQQLHAMGQMGQMPPEYIRHAMQQMSENQQRSSMTNEQANVALYRQYQAALQQQQGGGGGMAQPQILLRPGMQMPQDLGGGGSNSQNRSSHGGGSNAPGSGPHSDRDRGGVGGGQNSDHGSQRVGGITSGQPVFGHTLAHPYGMASGGAAVSNRESGGSYPRTGASS
ncbi:hypothetical protein BV898_05447 [Hypsibius exemplaris]|uniref:Uncharacterized protein n=1 Tax=Hypsibius exemplaris TaxID=2072580 RepID=A0A1W0WZI7_HYPEX|nr:hypothetical protein BV898_05447 [Hypsibius exemplaris]